MKKWLDDLYAIILKRGFKTLDNSLKNYESNQDIINQNEYITIGAISLENNESTVIDLSNYDLNVYFSVGAYSSTSYSRFYLSLNNTGTALRLVNAHYTGFDNAEIDSSNKTIKIKNTSGAQFNGVIKFKNSL